MEENGIVNPWEFSKSIEIMSLISSKITSNPLFSCIITLYILLLLYSPHGFSLKMILSPVLIITASILLSLLRMGAIQKFQPENRRNFPKTEFSIEEPKKIQSFNKAEKIEFQHFDKAEETDFSIEETRKIQSFNEAEETIFSIEETKKIQSFNEAEETNFSIEETKKIQSFNEAEESEFSIEEKKIQSFSKTEETEFSDEESEKIQSFSKADETEISDEEFGWVEFRNESESEIKLDFHCFDPNPSFEPEFVKWDVGAPLEVIYEEYEGEEDEKEMRHRFPVFSPYFSGSDSDCSSENNLPAPEKMGFRWEEEDKEELIEIALGTKGSEFHGEEEMNLIEIDIFSSQKF